jgi:crotonobetainyl-CoA:carnitine CoA-transferase CaiB-like acyl-CoA transferase
MNWLQDFVVVELATGTAGPYAGKRFADAGARVIKVQPPDGDPLRRRLPPSVMTSEDSALYTHPNIGKESLTVTVDDPTAHLTPASTCNSDRRIYKQCSSRLA